MAAIRKSRSDRTFDIINVAIMMVVLFIMIYPVYFVIIASVSEPNEVVSGNVYRLPNRAEAWDSPVPGSILGALWLANILHPQTISEAECTARMNEFYETFYHFTYTEN